MIVSVYLPNGYATPEEFARDCGVELVGQPCSTEGSARRLAEHFGYDWSKIDSYRTGACLIPSSRTNDEMCARADFMKIAKIVLSPSEEQSDRRGDAPVSDQSGEGKTPGDAIVRAGTPGTGENLSTARELELLRKIEALVSERASLREQLETAQSIHANEVRMHSKTREKAAAAVSLRWQTNLVFIVSRADFGNSSLTMRQIEEIIEDDGRTRPEDALERWRPYNSVSGRPDPMTPPSTTVA